MFLWNQSYKSNGRGFPALGHDLNIKQKFGDFQTKTKPAPSRGDIARLIGGTRFDKEEWGGDSGIGSGGLSGWA